MIGIRDIDRFLQPWEMDARDLHRRMILAPTPRERALWVWACALEASASAQGMERDPHTIGRWLAAFGKGGLQP